VSQEIDQYLGVPKKNYQNQSNIIQSRFGPKRKESNKIRDEDRKKPEKD
jgi:hypothetical protein